MSGIAQQLSEVLKRGWWRVLLRGLAAIALGVLAFVRPDIALASLVYAFGIYFLVDGGLAAWTAIEGRKLSEYWWVLLLGGLAGIGAGILTFIYPGMTALVLLFYVAAFAIVRGALEIAAGIRLRKEIEGEWMLVLSGLLSVAFGVILMARPGPGIQSILWLLGGFAVVYGILLLVLAFKVRSFVWRATAPA